MYADAFGLFVFGAFFTSVSLSKMTFLTDCKAVQRNLHRFSECQ